MSIWLLLIYAISMLTAAIGFFRHSAGVPVAQWIFLSTLIVFLLGVALRGIRRPAV